jgi:hypothetical protein
LKKRYVDPTNLHQENGGGMKIFVGPLCASHDNNGTSKGLG